MPLCGPKSVKKRESNITAQKVVIPKGVVNPDETTIIEIPARLHKQPIVVAKRKNMEVDTSVGKDPTGRSNLQKDGTPSRTKQPTVSVSASYKKSDSKNFNPPFNSTFAPGGERKFQTTNHETMDNMGIDASFDLDQTEEQERRQLEMDLEAFQKARRKLIEHASKFASLPPNYT